MPEETSPEPRAKAPATEADNGLTLGQKLRLGAAAFVGLLVIIFLASNWEPVPVEFIGFAPELPLAVWLFGSVSGGFVIGWTVHALRSRKSDKK